MNREDMTVEERTIEHLRAQLTASVNKVRQLENLLLIPPKKVGRSLRMVAGLMEFEFICVETEDQRWVNLSITAPSSGGDKRLSRHFRELEPGQIRTLMLFFEEHGPIAVGFLEDTLVAAVEDKMEILAEEDGH